MSDKKYPYVGKFAGLNATVIFASQDSGLDLRRAGGYRDDLYESVFKNITREYLANTYGEVKDARHAGFIKALAVSGGFHCGDNYNSDYQFFSFDDDELYFWCRAEQARGYGEKQITIPQPPECWSMDDKSELEQRNMTAKVDRKFEIKGNFDHLSDGEFLSWICDRLNLVYGESENIDYMRRLRNVAARLDESALGGLNGVEWPSWLKKPKKPPSEELLEDLASILGIRYKLTLEKCVSKYNIKQKGER